MAVTEHCHRADRGCDSDCLAAAGLAGDRRAVWRRAPAAEAALAGALIAGSSLVGILSDRYRLRSRRMRGRILSGASALAADRRAGVSMTPLRVWLGLLAALWLALPCANPAAAEDERRVALVIGNARYERAPPLLNAANDARALAA